MNFWLLDQGNTRLKLACVRTPDTQQTSLPLSDECFAQASQSIANSLQIFQTPLPFGKRPYTTATTTGSCQEGAQSLTPEWLQQTALPRPDVIVGVCVASEDLRALRQQQLQQVLGTRVPFYWLQSQPQLGCVINHYLPPTSLGADRWMALVAAQQHYPGQACLIANFGTATTVDALDARGAFLGGVILPGIDLMRACLAQGTAKLSVTGGSLETFARHTADALHSGGVWAQFGAVMALQQQLSTMTRSAPLLIASGGAWPTVAPAWSIMATPTPVPAPVYYCPHLVLEGLYLHVCAGVLITTPLAPS